MTDFYMTGALEGYYREFDVYICSNYRLYICFGILTVKNNSSNCSKDIFIRRIVTTFYRRHLPAESKQLKD